MEKEENKKGKKYSSYRSDVYPRVPHSHTRDVRSRQGLSTHWNPCYKLERLKGYRSRPFTPFAKECKRREYLKNTSSLHYHHILRSSHDHVSFREVFMIGTTKIKEGMVMDEM